MTSNFKFLNTDLDSIFELSNGSTDLGFDTGYVCDVDGVPTDIRYRYAPLQSPPRSSIGYTVNVAESFFDLAELFEPAMPPFYSLRSTLETMEYSSSYLDPSFWTAYSQAGYPLTMNTYNRELGSTITLVTEEGTINIPGFTATFDVYFQPSYVQFKNNDLTVTNSTPSVPATTKINGYPSSGRAILDSTVVATIWEIKIESTPSTYFYSLGTLIQYYNPNSNPNSNFYTHYWASDGTYKTYDMTIQNEIVLQSGVTFGPGDVIGLKMVYSSRIPYGDGFEYYEPMQSLWYYKNGVLLNFNSRDLGVGVSLPDPYVYTSNSNDTPPPPPPPPPPYISNFSASPTSGPAPLTVSFTDLSSSGTDIWNWDFKDDGSAISTEQNPTYTYTVPGVYSVRLLAQKTSTEQYAFETKYDYITVT